MAADARAATVLTAVPPRASPDVDGRAEVVIGQPVQALDLVGKRLDRADPLHVRRARMSGAPGYLQLYKSGSLAPRDEIAVRPPGLGIEHCARVLCLGLDGRARGRGGDLLVRGVEAGQRARRAKAVQRFEHEGVHHEACFHVGDSRAESLVAVDPERALCGGAVGKHRVAMSHQYDRPVVPVGAGQPGRHAVAISRVANRFARNAARIEMGSQPIPDRINPALVVAAGIDVHEFRQHRDHRLMLPAEMLENGGLSFNAHGALREDRRGSRDRSSAKTASDSMSEEA